MVILWVATLRVSHRVVPAIVVFCCLYYYNAHLVYIVGIPSFLSPHAFIAVGNTAAAGGEVCYCVIVEVLTGTFI
jgi:hypothetical protein